jgi:hypothetical protein
MVLAVCMFTVMLTESRAQTIAVSPSSVTMGGSVTASWSGFSGNVNLGVYTGNGLLCYANTNFNPSVTLSQVLSTSGNCPAGVVWTARSDYRVGIELRTAPFTVTYSNYFSVTPAPPTLTSPTNNSSLPVGQNITFQWSNSSGSVSNSSIKVCTNSAMTQNCQVFESGLTQTIVSASMFTTGVTQYWQARSRTSTSEWGIYGPTPAWSFTLIAPIISPHVSEPGLLPMVRQPSIFLAQTDQARFPTRRFYQTVPTSIPGHAMPARWGSIRITHSMLHREHIAIQ